MSATPAEPRPRPQACRRPRRREHPRSAGSRVARVDVLDRAGRCGQLSRPWAGVHGEHDREHRAARVRHRGQRWAACRGAARVARGVPRRFGRRRRDAARIGHRHAQHLARALGIETGLILAAAIVAAAADVEPSTFWGYAVIALLALGMGVRNATVRRLGVPDLTTTVLTMTLTGLAADSRAVRAAGRCAGSRRYWRCCLGRSPGRCC